MKGRVRLAILMVLAMVMMTITVAPALATDGQCPPPTCTCGCNPGVRSPGFWKNHPDAWPVDSIVIGGKTFTKEEAIEFMSMPTAGDKRVTLFRALISVKLNHLIGNNCASVCAAATAADAWFVGKWSAPVRASSCCWQIAEPWYLCMDAYNNGLLGVPSAD